jgi:molybdenum cofactor cytidylyltransferase
MGKQKLLLPFAGKTLIQTVLANVAGSRVDRILVVLGSDWEKVRETIKPFSVGIALNPDFRSGMLSSVLCGIRALPGDTQAVLIVLGDQPMISSAVINRILAAFPSSGKGIIVPTYEGRRGHPLLIDLKYKAEIEALDPGTGLRGLIRRHAEDLFEVEVPSPAILKDIDNRQDYLQEAEGPAGRKNEG